MKLEDVEVKVGVGVGQVMSIAGMIAGYGVTIAGAIGTFASVLPKNATTIAVLGFGSLLGTASNWLLVKARNHTIEQKVNYAVAALYHAGQAIEDATGLDLPVVEKDVAPPTI